MGMRSSGHFVGHLRAKSAILSISVSTRTRKCRRWLARSCLELRNRANINVNDQDDLAARTKFIGIQTRSRISGLPPNHVDVKPWLSLDFSTCTDKQLQKAYQELSGALDGIGVQLANPQRMKDGRPLNEVEHAAWQLKVMKFRGLVKEALLAARIEYDNRIRICRNCRGKL